MKCSLNASCQSDIGSVDFEQSDDEELIPRSQNINRRTISTSSETSFNEEAEEWSSSDNPGVNVADVPESVIDAPTLKNEDVILKDYVNKNARLKKTVVPSLKLPQRLHNKKVNIKMIQEHRQRTKKREVAHNRQFINVEH
ncbi:hypothetical protein RN001_001201 [Aquatica leii]|uniref:Uncharacterized protein n=1 Tax=Aquatica leii TaxID=1421715 RepID=A0AAN7QA75_9COLE|nr:hypothetical protein RN001_001201 [Aquatica leii]